MAHFAQLDSNNVVTQVIVVGNDDITDSNGNEVESIGVAFCQKLLGADTNWKQTSYNGNMRTRYAGIGYSYNSSLDAFVPPQPHASWTLNSTSKDWQAPITEPTLSSEDAAAGKYYVWNETAYQDDSSDPKTAGWVLTTPGE